MPSIASLNEARASAEKAGDWAAARALKMEVDRLSALEAKDSKPERGASAERGERPPLSGTDYLKGLGRVAAQGVGMGFGDEAIARARSMFEDRQYDELRQEERDLLARFNEENPYTSLGVEAAGSMLPTVAAALVPGGQPAAVANAARTAGALSRFSGAAKGLASKLNPFSTQPGIGAATRTGALQGAIGGAGTAEEMENVPAGAVTGAMVGGGTGFALPTLFSAAAKGVTRVVDAVAPTNAGAVGRARDYFMKKVLSSRDIPDIAALEAKLKADEALKVPLGFQYQSAPLERAAQVAVARSTAGADLAKDVLRVNSGNRARTLSQLNTALKPDDYFGKTDQLVERMKTRAKPFYEKAYAAAKGIQETPELTAVLNRPGAREIWEEALADPAFTLLGNSPGKMVWSDGRRVMSQPSLETLDQFKRALDRKINLLERAPANPQSQGTEYPGLGSLRKYRGQFMDALENALPREARDAWKEARDVYRGDAEIRDALNLGRSDFLSMAPQELERAIAEFKVPVENEAFRSGAFEALREVFRGATNTLLPHPASASRNAAGSLMGDDDMRQKMRMLVGDDRLAELMEKALIREADIFRANTSIAGGSPTALRTQAIKDFDQDEGGVELLTAGARAASAAATGNPTQMFHAAADIFKRLPMGEARATELARLFQASTPREIDAVLRTLEAHSGQRAAQAQRMGRVVAPVRGSAAYGLATVGREQPESDESREASAPPAPLAPNFDQMRRIP